MSTSVGWLSLHASLPDGAGGRRVAVVLQPAFGEQAAALHLETHGLTSREREVARLVARGCQPKRSANTCSCPPGPSRITSRQSSRRPAPANPHELRAKIFFHDFLPGIAARAPLDAHGQLVHPEP